MENVTIQAKNAVGDPLGSPFVLSGSFVWGSKFGSVRLNQSSVRTTDGILNTEDNGITIIKAQLRIEYVDEVLGDEFKTYIRDTLKFRKFRFDITQSHPLINVGNGKDETTPRPALNCNLLVKDDTDIFQPVPPNDVHIVLPYSFKS